MPIGVTPEEISLAKVVLPLGPVGNDVVNTVDSAVRYSVYLTNPGGDILTDAETSPGTYVVHRIRSGTDTEIVSATAATEASGVVSTTIDFSDPNWVAGDLGYIEFSGITATLVDTTTELPVLRKGFRVLSEASATALATLQAALDALGVGGRLIFPSDGVQATVVLPSVAANLSLPNVTVADLPANLTIDRVTAAIAYRKQVDSSGSANAVNVAQQIQVRSDTPGTFRNAIKMADNSLATAAGATEGGMMILGGTDISVEVTGEDTYNFQWTSADVDGASLTLHDVQTYLIIQYS